MSKKQTVIVTVTLLVSLLSLICLLLVPKPQPEIKYIKQIRTIEREPIKEVIYIEKKVECAACAALLPAELDLPQCNTDMFYAEQDYIINNPRSHQYKLLHDENTYVKDNGMYVYQYNGEEYCLVAMGDAYGKQIGLAFKVTLENGTAFNVIMGDFKGVFYGHECKNLNREYCINVIEFICDLNKLPEEVIWKGTFSAQDEYNANIKSIEILGKIWSVPE